MPQSHTDVANRYKHEIGASSKLQPCHPTPIHTKTVDNSSAMDSSQATATTEDSTARSGTDEIEESIDTAADDVGPDPPTREPTEEAAVPRPYTADELEQHRESLDAIQQNLDEYDLGTMAITIDVLKDALAGRTVEDVPPLGQDGGFRAWATGLRPAMVSGVRRTSEYDILELVQVYFSKFHMGHSKVPTADLAALAAPVLLAAKTYTRRRSAWKEADEEEKRKKERAERAEMQKERERKADWAAAAAALESEGEEDRGETESEAAPASGGQRSSVHAGRKSAGVAEGAERAVSGLVHHAGCTNCIAVHGYVVRSLQTNRSSLPYPEAGVGTSDPRMWYLQGEQSEVHLGRTRTGSGAGHGGPGGGCATSEAPR
jgi:hypothetical protein